MSAEEPLTRAEPLRRRRDALESEKCEVLAELAELEQSNIRPAADPQPTSASASASLTASFDSARRRLAVTCC